MQDQVSHIVDLKSRKAIDDVLDTLAQQNTKKSSDLQFQSGQEPTVEEGSLPLKKRFTVGDNSDSYEIKPQRPHIEIVQYDHHERRMVTTEGDENSSIHQIYKPIYLNSIHDNRRLTTRSALNSTNRSDALHFKGRYKAKAQGP